MDSFQGPQTIPENFTKILFEYSYRTMQHLHYDGSPILIVQYTTLGYDPVSNGLQLIVLSHIMLIAADIMCDAPNIMFGQADICLPKIHFFPFSKFFWAFKRGKYFFFLQKFLNLVIIMWNFQSVSLKFGYSISVFAL